MKAATGPQARRGCVSLAAYYGLFIVLIPMVGGGFFGSVLKLFTVPEGPAYAIGVAIAVTGSAWTFLAIRRHERTQKAFSERQKELVATLTELPVLELAVDRLWAIESDPDWPDYLLRNEDGTYLLLSTPHLQLVDPPFARRHLRITLLPPHQEDIVSLEWAGGALRDERLRLPTPHEEWPGRGEATLVTFQELPSEWQRLLIAV